MNCWSFTALVRAVSIFVLLAVGNRPASAESTAQPPAPSLPTLVPSPRGDGSTIAPMRRTTSQDRAAAGLRALERRKANEAAGLQKPARQAAPVAPARTPEKGPTSLNGVRGVAEELLRLAIAQVGTPDYYSFPNYAVSKLPTATCVSTTGVPTGQTCMMDSDCAGYLPPFLIGPFLYPTGETCTGPVVAGTGIRKFVDTLPGLCALGTNNLGSCLPLAVPDTTTFPGSDYYEIGLKEYASQFHTDLPVTPKLRGYYQKNTTDPFAGQPHYLGPVILAQTNRPVRVKFVNELPIGAGGDLAIPMDATLGGTDLGPDGLPYTQNRATVHLHGGNTPWISDGTQHQWTVPAGETTTHKKGLAVDYVPDMWFDAAGNLLASCAGSTTCSVAGATNDPGEGALTFYYTNQQSGRLMFYHDHAYGITRLNVYVGEAAGYLLVNPPDEDVLAAATVPGTIGTTPDLAHMIPLVIQDRTFVPPAAQLALQDPTWDPVKWGGEGALWYPHVYTPNQWPDNPDLSNTNPFGRWDYGPWFWPVQSSLTTVTWDGQPVARPLTVPCTSAAAVTPANPTGATVCPSTPLPTLTPESFMDTPVVNGTAYPTLTVDPVSYRFQILNAANDRYFNLSFFLADATGTEVTMVPAIPHLMNSVPPLCPAATATNVSAVTGTLNGPDLTTPTCWPREWPTDGRQGGVPDPATVGPKWIQLGSEAGLLPSPAVLPPRPTVFEQNKRNIVVLNVADKSLFMGPAERADVVVDFSAYAGKTLILYNDSPAPVPAGDPRLDYFTGNADNTVQGGAPTTLPGYGPNIRTVMQVKVRAAPAGGAQAPLDPVAITTALNQRFAASQPKPVVPESVYNPVYAPVVPYSDTYLPIQAMSLTFTPVGGAAPMTVPFGNKALHELFTADYGRMNSLLGVEIPNTNWLNQTTIPFANFDPTTEYLPDNQVQIWKITHNGVDTHTIHFHLFNVQIVNRVGWDGQIRAPDANELGWKEAVRMNPLEDIIVALQPVRQNLPWPLPDKWRPLDVDRPLGTASQFTGVDVNNNPIAITNTLVNFGWEYVWHCHLLGHEENDMLRAEVLVAAPEAPSGLSVSQLTPADPAVLTFTDNSKSALTFNVQRDTTPSFLAPTTFSVASAGPGPMAVTISDAGIAPGTAYYYRVQAEKSLSSSAYTGALQGSASNPFVATSAWSNVAQLGAVPLASVAPLALDFLTQAVLTTSAPQTVTISATGAGLLAVSGIAIAGANAGDFAQTNTCAGGVAGGASCTVDVTFRPTATGTRAATLTILTSDPANPSFTVTLGGVGAAGLAQVAPTTLAFGAQVVNTTSAPPLTVTVTNSGTLPLTVNSVAIGGLSPADFAQTNTCPAAPAALAPAASCTISVTFHPSVLGARGASLTVSTSDPFLPTATVLLDGTGVAPLLTAAPASLTFLNQIVTAPPTASPAQTVTVTNAGTSAVAALAVALAGANAAEFAQTSNCGATLAAGASCTVSVTFAPATFGPKSAALAISGSDGVNPLPGVTVGLTGSDVAPVATVSPNPLAFPNAQVLNTTSPPQVLSLSNTGGAPLAIGAVTISGDFAMVNGCGATLAPGASCAISVTFTPTAAGPLTGAVTIASSDPVNPVVTATLNGTGSSVSLSPAAVAFGSQLVGVSSAIRTVTVVNTGSTALTAITLSVTGVNAGDFTFTTSCGTSLAAGRSCTVNLRFRPAAAGPSAAALNVASSDPAGTQLVALSGTGVAPIATAAPTAITNFSTPLNVASAPQTVTLSNTGTAPLVITGIALGGTNGSQFTQTNGCPIGGAGLAVGASCTIDVTFLPTTFGGVATKTATLTVNVAAPATAATVALTGTIVTPTFTLSPAALTFAKQTVNTTSAAQTVTMANTGTAPVGIRGITLAGANPGSFAQTNNCGTSLAAGASCTIDVTFTPTRVGARSATLNVRVSAPAVSQSVTLSGTGQ